MSPADAAELARLMGAELSRKGTTCYPGLTLRVGKLNLIVESSDEKFAVWVQGTNELAAVSPVTREFAVATFKRLRGNQNQKGSP